MIGQVPAATSVFPLETVARGIVTASTNGDVWVRRSTESSSPYRSRPDRDIRAGREMECLPDLDGRIIQDPASYSAELNACHIGLDSLFGNKIADWLRREETAP